MIVERFAPASWQAAYRAQVRRAFREVPYYREQWAVAGAPLREPNVSKAETLESELYRLCPLARAWRPDAEPALWTGRRGVLRDALRMAGLFDPRVPVLEMRRSLVDWRTLGGLRPVRYGVLLAPDADTGQAGRRAALALPAAALAAQAGTALLIGGPAELPPCRAELETTLDGLGVELRVVPRLTLATASAHSDPTALLHDPVLGYLGARLASCGAHHLNWRRYHAHLVDGVLAFTALRQQRPMLVNVAPGEPGFSRIGRCPRHGSPVLEG